MLNSLESSHEMSKEFPYTTIVIYKDKVYDVTRFDHPGGSYLLRLFNWSEVSRFMHGYLRTQKGHNITHLHSQMAFDVLNKNLIGSLIDKQENHAS